MKKYIIGFLLFFLVLNLFGKKDDVLVYNIQKGNVFHFYADNPNIVPYQIVIYFKKDKEKFLSIVKANSVSNFLFSYTNSSRCEPVYSVKKIIGDPNNVKANEDYPYLLPFAHGTEFKVSQGYGTRFTHRGWLKYSIDFSMNIGSSIYAARGGVVVAVKDDSKVGGRSRRYKGHANYITIAHDDGTFAQYVHLNFAGSLVKVGDVVKAGDLIGYSGRTGRVTGPHLHFMVYKPIEGGLETIPIKFLMQDGSIAYLQSKKFYTGYNPDIDDKELLSRKGQTNSYGIDDEDSLGEP
ncbi:MAG: M23 family metallopeptidase [Brevinematales bacterium]|nr:M23 family metallopeptidase [Brevinematales bacterium]